MQLIRSEITRLFAIGFLAGALMVGAMNASGWNEDFAPQAYAQDQTVSHSE